VRVTRESLVRIARETVQERAYNDPAIVAAYLTGSLRREEPMLGGTTDIDLVFVLAAPSGKQREYVRLTPDFHIDILCRAKEDYRSLRDLRSDPWLGYEMYDPQLLFEREKFFEFVQAGLRAGNEFDAAPYTLERCRSLYNQARGIWLELSDPSNASPIARQLRQYLDSIYAAVNAVAELSGPPLAERRLLLEFPERARAAGREGMHAGVIGLLGGGQLQPARMDRWLPDWQRAFEAAGETPGSDARLHPARLNYYMKAIKAMLGSDSPVAALWPLLQTWTLAASSLERDQLGLWQSACADLELTGSALTQRLHGLDHWLDEIDLLLEQFAESNGLVDAVHR
jgi:hypothetical protein